MTTSFRLPDLGEGVHEAEILALPVSIGQAVTEGDVIMEIETDKAAVEIPSPYTGTVREIMVKVGDMAVVGDVLISFATKSKSTAPPPPPAESSPAAADSADKSPNSELHLSTKKDPRFRPRLRLDDWPANSQSICMRSRPVAPAVLSPKKMSITMPGRSRRTLRVPPQLTSRHRTPQPRHRPPQRLAAAACRTSPDGARSNDSPFAQSDGQPPTR